MACTLQASQFSCTEAAQKWSPLFKPWCHAEAFGGPRIPKLLPAQSDISSLYNPVDMKSCWGAHAKQPLLSHKLCEEVDSRSPKGISAAHGRPPSGR